MTTTADSKSSEKFEFQAEANRLLHLVIHSLYTNKEIFLRELLSNASDALDKLRFRSLTEHDLVAKDHAFEVRITPLEDESILVIEDRGIGMTHDELVQNLGTIAHSGTRAFLEAMEKGEETDVNLIGQFGVGFYSAFLVADTVDVITRAAGSDQAYRWSSQAQGEFTIEPAERDSCGTEIRLHLKEEHKDYLNEWRLRQLVEQYSDYIDYGILLQTTKTEGEGDDAKTVKEYEKVNKASALWRRDKSDISDEQYNEFYTHLSHDATEPLTRLHFTLEGMQVFTSLLFVPGTPPFDLFYHDSKKGLRLYVKRVFIMDDAEQLLPPWLRFVKGVVDSDDLPLNVSRETLQDSGGVRKIRSNITGKLLSHFEKLAKDDKETFEKIWTHYAAVIKEGIHSDFEFKDRIAAICRFKTSRDEDWSTLDEYIERMPEGQESIYYVLGESRERLAGSPHLELLKSKGYEYLYLTDPIDQWAMDSLREYKEKKLVNAMSSDMDLDDSEEAKKKREEQAGELKPVIDKIQDVLEESVREVRVSDRLTDSPCCLVVPTGMNSAFLERLMQQQAGGGAVSKRIFEINPEHTVIRKLATMIDKDADGDEVREWIEMLHDQALLTEGSPVKDPNRFARWMNRLFEDSLTATDGGNDKPAKKTASAKKASAKKAPAKKASAKTASKKDKKAD